MNSKFTNFEGDNLDNYLGHEMVEINENYVESKLVITKNHKQPMGLVHGGIYSTLAETICSYGANFNDEGVFVGVNNNTDFLSSVTDGEIICKAVPIRKGRSFQLWECKILHEDKLVAVSKVRLSRIQ
jgi:1,4-dihydroxy-2-naphthoyl-CoA hydrolase